MEALIEPFVWLLSSVLWVVAYLLFFAFICAVPIILLWIGWFFFKKQMKQVGVKEEWLKKITSWYLLVVFWWIKFCFYILPVSLFCACRSVRKKAGDWLQAKHPVWYTRMHRFRML